MSTAIAHAVTAEPLAAMLPSRRGAAWRVVPAAYAIRPDASMSRLINGSRALVVVEEAGRIEVYADRGDRVRPVPDAVVDAAGPDAVDALSGRVLRHVLPMLEREAASLIVAEHGRHGAIAAIGASLSEVGFSLIEHGAHPGIVGTMNGPALVWKTGSGATWTLGVHGTVGNLTLTYEGPASGLYGVLPVLLPPHDGRTPADSGSTFTRALTDRFPQLYPIGADELEFYAYKDLNGYIALPEKAAPTDRFDDTTEVVAEVKALGVDLMLTTVAHLV